MNKKHLEDKFKFKVGDKLYYRAHDFKSKHIQKLLIIEITAIGEDLFLGKELGCKSEHAFNKGPTYTKATQSQIDIFLKSKLPPKPLRGRYDFELKGN